MVMNITGFITIKNPYHNTGGYQLEDLPGSTKWLKTWIPNKTELVSH
jgi:hypothetical protein